jgi:hypothetical protein
MDKKNYDGRHGGPYDRGSADSYYGRGFQPHYYKGNTYGSERVVELTKEELEAYRAGYEQNERDGNFKDWG